MTPPCLMCMERHFKCHSYCKNYIDYKKKKENNKPKDTFYDYACFRGAKRFRKEVRKAK